jgi:hypothetical protein
MCDAGDGAEWAEPVDVAADNDLKDNSRMMRDSLRDHPNQ